MAKPTSTICGWKTSQIKSKYLLRVVEDPKFFCQECGRVANKKKWVCMPKKLRKFNELQNSDG
jgi:hypothetical protein